MDDNLEILFDEAAVSDAVHELAARISRDYAGKEPVLISVLKGAAIFTADLMRCITVPVTVEFVQVASYGCSTTSSRNITLVKDLTTDIRGKHVLLVDTIIDTGETMAWLLNKLGSNGPASINIVALLNKQCRRTVEVPIAYMGIEIPDKFVVGYGMDCGEHYRNLPYIAMIKA